MRISTLTEKIQRYQAHQNKGLLYNQQKNDGMIIDFLKVEKNYEYHLRVLTAEEEFVSHFLLQLDNKEVELAEFNTQYHKMLHDIVELCKQSFVIFLQANSNLLSSGTYDLANAQKDLATYLYKKACIHSTISSRAELIKVHKLIKKSLPAAEEILQHMFDMRSNAAMENHAIHNKLYQVNKSCEPEFHSSINGLCLQKNYEKIKECLSNMEPHQAAALINQQDKLGCLALNEAIHGGNMELIKFLLFCGANPLNQDIDGFDAWSYASQRGDLMVLTHLKARGYFPPGVKKKLTTSALNPVHVAAYYNKAELVLWWKNNYPELVTAVDAQANSALHFAAQNASRDTLKQLLSFGFDPLTVNKQGISACYIAAQTGILACLLDMGYGLTPAEIAALSCEATTAHTIQQAYTQHLALLPTHAPVQGNKSFARSQSFFKQLEEQLSKPQDLSVRSKSAEISSASQGSRTNPMGAALACNAQALQRHYAQGRCLTKQQIQEIAQAGDQEQIQALKMAIENLLTPVQKAAKIDDLVVNPS